MNTTQLDLFNQMLGEEGFCFDAVQCNQLMNRGVKLFYLEHVLTEKPEAFKLRLGQLYQISLDLDEEASFRDTMIGLEQINLLFWGSFDDKFAQLGPAVDREIFQQEVKKRVLFHQTKLVTGQLKAVQEEKKAYQAVVADIPVNMGWKSKSQPEPMTIEALESSLSEAQEDTLLRLLQRDGDATYDYLLGLAVDDVLAILDEVDDVEVAAVPAPPAQNRHSFFNQASRRMSDTLTYLGNIAHGRF